MNRDILNKHIDNFISEIKKNPIKFNNDCKERSDFITYYQKFTKNKILSMDKDTVYEYLSKLWAMMLWGNKHYVVDKIINDNGLENFKKNLSELLWSEQDISIRWDDFRKNIKGMGSAMVSEITL